MVPLHCGHFAVCVKPATRRCDLIGNEQQPHKRGQMRELSRSTRVAAGTERPVCQRVLGAERLANTLIVPPQLPHAWCGTTRWAGESSVALFVCNCSIWGVVMNLELRPYRQSGGQCPLFTLSSIFLHCTKKKEDRHEDSLLLAAMLNTQKGSISAPAGSSRIPVPRHRQTRQTTVASRKHICVRANMVSEYICVRGKMGSESRPCLYQHFLGLSPGQFCGPDDA